MFNVDDNVYFISKIINIQGNIGRVIKIKKFLFWKKYLIAERVCTCDFCYWVKEKNIIKKI